MLPHRHDPRWRTLIEDPARYEYAFLALRILMHRVAKLGASDPERALDEVYEFFQQNERFLDEDIAAVFG
jgi:hypothetical protein